MDTQIRERLIANAIDEVAKSLRHRCKLPSDLPAEFLPTQLREPTVFDELLRELQLANSGQTEDEPPSLISLTIEDLMIAIRYAKNGNSDLADNRLFSVAARIMWAQCNIERFTKH